MFVPISPGSEAKAGFGPNSQYAISSIWKDGSWGDLQLLEIDNFPKIPITSNTPNYGMSVFEGMKEHEDAQGLIRVFRALTH
ncbi:MAG: hypothetical protein QG583_755, partial [Patescibacteria group bacterium]|nr:hypothetical protein [Patescibacteria group bacterium]